MMVGGWGIANGTAGGGTVAYLDYDYGTGDAVPRERCARWKRMVWEFGVGS